MTKPDGWLAEKFKSQEFRDAYTREVVSEARRQALEEAAAVADAVTFKPDAATGTRMAVALVARRIRALMDSGGEASGASSGQVCESCREWERRWAAATDAGAADGERVIGTWRALGGPEIALHANGRWGPPPPSGVVEKQLPECQTRCRGRKDRRMP